MDKELYKERYGVTPATPFGMAPDFNKCAEEVSDYYTGVHQCKRRRGHGPDGAYCKKHAEVHDG